MAADVNGIGVPPATSTFISWPWAKKAAHRPSGEKNGCLAPFEDATARASNALRSRRYSTGSSEPCRAAYAMVLPSEVIAGYVVSSCPGGSAIDSRADVGSTAAGPRHSAMPATTASAPMAHGADRFHSGAAAAAGAAPASSASIRRASPIAASRSFRSFSRHHRNSGCTRAGASEISGSRFSTLPRISTAVSPWNRLLPVSSSWTMTPNAQMSARWSAVLPLACSGLMYAAVPRIMPACGGLDGQRRRVVGVAAGRSGQHRLGEAEIQDLHHAAGGDLDVGGLEIAMDDAPFVRGFDAVDDLTEDRQRVAERSSARCSVSPSTNSITRIVRGDVVEVADVGVVQRRDRARLAREPLGELGVRDLDRDVAIQARIAGAIHLAHAARADQRLNFVGTESVAGSKRHGGGFYRGSRLSFPPWSIASTSEETGANRYNRGQ